MKYEIVIGQTYNMLTVVEFDRKEKGDYYYKCKCGVCGKIVSKRKDKILSNPKSCGCLNRIEDLNDIVGKKVGKLTVIEYDHKVYNGKKTSHYYKCKCDCGNTCIVRRDGLKSGNTRSCGCLASELTSARMSIHCMKVLDFIKYMMILLTNYKLYHI